MSDPTKDALTAGEAAMNLSDNPLSPEELQKRLADLGTYAKLEVLRELVTQVTQLQRRVQTLETEVRDLRAYVGPVG